jgi:uncharacterized protein
MPDDVFEWDDPRDERGNTRHVARHGVTPAQAEQALSDPDGFDAPTYPTATEERYAYVGATEAGRILFVVYTERDERIRIITAYRAERDEREAYIARRAGYQ